MKKTSFNSAAKRLKAYVAENGLRQSSVRLMVLEQACMLSQPFTADRLAKACEEERISVGTVYNALELFVKANIFHAVNRQRGRMATEYEVVAENQIRMQTICQKCGRVSNFHDPAIELIVRARKFSNFNLQHFTLFAYGECKKCKQKKKVQDN